MKHYFLATSLLLSSSLFAQQNELVNIDSLIKKRIDDQIKQKLHLPVLKAEIDNYTFSVPVKTGQPSLLASPLPNGEYLLLLPADHMPCVVPDMRQFQTMPVKGNLTELKNNPGMIPNPKLRQD